MITLRGTRKLLTYLDEQPVESPPPPTNSLGNWYANLIPTVLGDLIMLTNERSLLTVAVPTELPGDFHTQFRIRAANMLVGIGITPDVIRQEIDEMNPLLYAKTASRSILGSMNDLAFHFQHYATLAVEEDDFSLSRVELALNQMPHGPLDYKYAADAARELLANKKSNLN
jgi:hypothetical protein